MRNNKKLLKTLLPLLGATTLAASAAFVVTSCSTNNQTNYISDAYFDEYAVDATSNNLAITYQSRDVQVKYNEETTLIVNTNSTLQTQGDLLFNWYVDKSDGEGYKLVQGGTLNTYRVDTTITKKATNILHYRYRVTATSRYDSSETISSDEINLTILPDSTTYVTVRTQPTATQTVDSGTSVTLSTVATISHSKTIGYQWFQFDSNNKLSLIEGATSASYTFTATNTTSSTLSNKFICRYYDTSKPSTYLNESNVAVVKINPAEDNDNTTDNKDNQSTTTETMTITSLSASNKVVNPNQSTVLSVTATSNLTTNFTYQWFELNNDGLTWSRIDGATEKDYTVTPSTANNLDHIITKTYMVQVKGKNITLQSSEVSVKIQPKSVYDTEVTSNITITSQSPTIQDLSTNNYLILFVNATNGTATNDLIFDWYVSKDGSEDYSLIQGGTNNAYTITSSQLVNITTETTWKFYANVYERGNKESTIQSNTFIVNIKPDKTTETTSKLEISKVSATKTIVSSGESTTLSVTASASDSSKITYQWYKLDSDGLNWTKITGATSASYTTSAESVTTSATRTYMVMVSNGTNTIQSNEVKITIEPKEVSTETILATATSKQNVAVLNSNDELLTKIDGAWYEINTNAENKSSLTYQWCYGSFGGNDLIEIEGATSSTFTPGIDLLKTVANSFGGLVTLQCKISRDGKVITTVNNPAALYLRVATVK